MILRSTKFTLKETLIKLRIKEIAKFSDETIREKLKKNNQTFGYLLSAVLCLLNDSVSLRRRMLRIYSIPSDNGAPMKGFEKKTVF